MPDLSLLTPRPGDAGGPVFREPWEAHAFAMALALHERGVYTWREWADALAAQIEVAQAEGDADLGDTYYRHWLRALEGLVLARAGQLARGLVFRPAAGELADRVRPGVDLRDSVDGPV